MVTRSILRPVLRPMPLPLTFDDGPSPSFSANFMSGSLPAGLTYTNSSTTRTYFGSDGLLKTAVANEPIFETLGGVFQGMRWEMEQRTNLATNSEGAAATWSPASNVTDAGTSITGFGASIAFGDNSVDRYSYKSVTTVDATRYTLSVFVQMDDGLAPVVGINKNSGDFSIILENDIATLNATVQHIAGSLYRVSVGKVAVAPINTNNGIMKHTTQSSRTFRVAGIQLEAGASASSYIPTAGSAVTRQPDVLTATSISPWYRQDEGTVLFEGIVTDFSAPRGISVFSDGTNTERQYANFSAVGTLVSAVNTTAGGLQAAMTTANATNVGAIHRAAHAYKANNFAAVLNGGTVVTDSTGSLPAPTKLRLGAVTDGTGAFPFMGYARRFDYYRTRLPNAQIQGMSRV